jgi:multidrug efflux pump subunit AcrB
LSILTSLIVLSLMGHTINVMTLGGHLAVRHSVDDATVGSKHASQYGHEKPLVRGARWRQQIAVPAFVSTPASASYLCRFCC